MQNIIIIDHDPSFLSDLEARLFIDEYKYEDMKFHYTGDAMQCGQMVREYEADLVAASAKMLHENVLTDQCPIIYYAHSTEEKRNFPNPDYEFLGMIQNTSVLLQKIFDYQSEPHPEKVDSDILSETSELESGSDNGTKPGRHKNAAEELAQQKQERTSKADKKASAKERSRDTGRKQTEARNDTQRLRDGIKKDYPEMEPARGITVYSAKGGVGKTTIACELASMLACTEHGRSHYKVCIADFNIDFGDVLNQLDFDPKKPCMTHWVADIRARLEDGEKAEKINYTAGQISAYLQVKKETGLSALLAPLTNQDSMDIRTDEIQVMARNLIENGGFDFVIFDTGNNTRDSSYIPMLYSEQILVILTQSINTANCCNGFFTTMSKINFDMSKFRLVLNRIQPQKATGLDPEELKEVFQNVKDSEGKPLYSITECYAQIKESDDVIKSGNDGIPLVVTEPSHEFARGVASIMANLTRRNYVLPEPEKKGFFSRLFKSKKDK